MRPVSLRFGGRHAERACYFPRFVGWVKRCDCPTLRKGGTTALRLFCTLLCLVVWLFSSATVAVAAAEKTGGKPAAKASDQEKPMGLKKKSPGDAPQAGDAKSAPAADAKPARANAATSKKPDAKPAASASAAPTATLPWIGSLDAGLARALADRKPILVRVVGSGCPWCRKLEEDMATADVQRELGRWTLVHLNQDRESDEADELGVQAVPALRVLTPGGAWVASHNGCLGAQELIAFLQKHFAAAGAAASDELVATAVPNAAAVIQLIAYFDDRSPALREAAIRRLLPHAEAARNPVVKSFREGSLSARLAALELLEAWKAPVQSLDPWHPETFTAEALAALEKWRVEASPRAAALAKLSAEQLAAARRDMDQMLRGTAAEAEAIRERLTRLRDVAGEDNTVADSVAKEVATRLHQATSDEDRQRLLALKYRLAASDALALRWPGGLMRLAATDSRQRQAAADELVGRASADDQPLLLELFADSDPLVRETSLRGLQTIGGKAATAALVKLLDDPEPNVRAAVLKQLTETPQRSLVPRVATYVAKENDADLVVHAIRFLRAASGAESVKCLVSLLSHRQWQVRAEAAEALGKSLHNENSVSLEVRADAYVALIGLLDDNDAFVVSRVVEGLSGIDTNLAVEPLIRAAGKHPDLMPKIVEILAESEKIREKALPHLRAFARHKNPAARAAALKGLAQAVPDEIEEELLAGLQAPENEVRMAAAAATFSFFERLRNNPQELTARRLTDRMESRQFEMVLSPTTTTVERLATLAARAVSKLASAKKAQDGAKPASQAKPDAEAKSAQQAGKAKPEEDAPDADGDRWLKRFYGGAGRPKWIARLVGPLQKMLAAEAAEERVEAALALVPMGEADRALKQLLSTVSSRPELLKRGCEVLPWLLWEKRLETFHRLRPLARDNADRQSVLYAMTETSDRRAADLYWQILAEPQATAESANVLHRGLRQAYYRESPHRSSGKPPAAYRRELAKAAKSHLDAAGEWTPFVALLLLAEADSEQAAKVAANLEADTKRSPELRTDAFQLLLVTQPRREATQTALAGMKGADIERRKRSLTYLVDGAPGLRVFRKHFYLNTEATTIVYSSDEKRGVPAPPPGVTIEHLQPLLESSDAQTAAYAGYLAALLGEAKGLPPLLRYWQQEGDKAHGAERLVYRAIAALDDSSQLPVLRQIYEKLQTYDMSDFYWTIRGMSGPEILKFRKEIRDKVGMDNLR